MNAQLDRPDPSPSADDREFYLRIAIRSLGTSVSGSASSARQGAFERTVLSPTKVSPALTQMHGHRERPDGSRAIWRTGDIVLTASGETPRRGRFASVEFVFTHF